MPYFWFTHWQSYSQYLQVSFKSHPLWTPRPNQIIIITSVRLKRHESHISIFETESLLHSYKSVYYSTKRMNWITSIANKMPSAGAEGKSIFPFLTLGYYHTPSIYTGPYVSCTIIHNIIYTFFCLCEQCTYTSTSGVKGIMVKSHEAQGSMAFVKSCKSNQWHHIFKSIQRHHIFVVDNTWSFKRLTNHIQVYLKRIQRSELTSMLGALLFPHTLSNLWSGWRAGRRSTIFLQQPKAAAVVLYI